MKNESIEFDELNKEIKNSIEESTHLIEFNF